MIDVSTLEGEALDAAVALALGWERVPAGWMEPTPDGCGIGHSTFSFKPSTDWRVGGPIIERERIELATHEDGRWFADAFLERWRVEVGVGTNGPTPLIAAMRAFVAQHKG